MAAFQAVEDRPRSFHIVTYGCQMNAHDSEKLSGMLVRMGMAETEDRRHADLVIFNTCCVRENAERRALGNVIWLKQLKNEKPNLLIAVCGCMIQQPHMAERILKQYPFIDLAFGTHNLYRLASLLLELADKKHRVISVSPEENMIAEGLPVKRLNDYKAYVTVMYGCDNFCTYCIVPFVRGRERSRRMEDILREAEKLQKSGVQEIMLLGQNVNSYGGGKDFPKLLKALDGIGIPRIRFMTSHPKDLSDELIGVMASGKNICNNLHLPVQSGSNAVLKAMNRGYTREQYMERVQALRSVVPDIGITSDFIVGFPGETEEQFMDSVSLVDAVGYDAAFTFIYSPRVGTAAAKLKAQVPAEVSAERIRRLIQAVEQSTARVHQSLIGSTEQVLVEGVSKRSRTMVSGKGRRNITVTFAGDTRDTGKLIQVKINAAAANTLRGERVTTE
ncbi:MAG: tRNA (N6-isopentenyl adenosine(37)-C2)-methylthiotransferase MiaB [Clostridiales bacterium]|nr:tRNA (N6-isopentenyl adenosine(37)-C2)-methylthiotransferase MiaB [Clostridiales bacterium]